MNPGAVIVMWMISIWMVAAVTAGPLYVFGVAVLATIYTVYALV